MIAVARYLACIAYLSYLSYPSYPSYQTAILHGRVVAADSGTPVRSAALRLTGAKQGQGVLLGSTDDEGRFEFQNVPAGSYSLQVVKTGFVTESFGLSPGLAEFGVSAGQRVDFGDLKLRRAGAIVGKVLDAFGDAVADVTVTAWRLEFMTPAWRRVVSARSFQTNDLGEFRLFGLMPGKYYVSADLRASSLAEAPTFYPGTAVFSEAQPVEVRGGQDTFGIVLPMMTAPYGVVTGTVTDSKGAPFTAGLVWLLSAKNDVVMVNSAQLSAATDAEGRFRIVNVSPGDYRVEVFSRALMDKIGKSGTTSLGPIGELGSATVSVASGRTAEVPVQTSMGHRVRGQVFLDGAPLSGAAAALVGVAAMPPNAGVSAASIPSYATVSTDGSFVLEGVRGLRVLGTQGSVAGAVLHRTLVNGADVTDRGVDVAADITGVEIHLTTKPPRIEGTVSDASGAPARDVEVVIFSVDRGDWLLPGGRRYQKVRPLGGGTFRVTGLAAGNYLAALVPREDADRAADPDYLEGLRGTATPVTITDGATSTVALSVKR